jgi:hypothetical protein
VNEVELATSLTSRASSTLVSHNGDLAHDPRVFRDDDDHNRECGQLFDRRSTTAGQGDIRSERLRRAGLLIGIRDWPNESDKATKAPPHLKLYNPNPGTSARALARDIPIFQ